MKKIKKIELLDIENTSKLPLKAEIVDALNMIKKRMNLNYTLTAPQRKNMASLGECRISFVNELIKTVKENPQIINGLYDINILNEKLQTSLYFLELACEVEQLMKQLSDYSQLMGAETYKIALLLKSQINTTCILNREYKAIAEKINKYFPAPIKKQAKKSKKSRSMKISPAEKLSKLA